MSKINLQKYDDLRHDNAPKNNGNATPIYGPYEKLLLSDWGQSEIHHDIVQAFDKMCIRQMKPIQKNSFLYLMNKYNVAMIGFAKGKSTSYLASIFSSIMNDSNDTMHKVAIGPKAIILSSSLGSCSTLEELSKDLIFSNNPKKKINVVVAYTSVSVQKTIGFLCNGCDILIATPTSFQNILSKTKLFSWLNLRHFVFDNLDLLLDNYKDQMIYFSTILMELKKNTDNIQMISASVKWTKDIEAFLNQLFVKWQYIFGSHLEAARFMQIGFSVVLAKNKLEKVLEYLNNNIKCHRCVLITSNTDELITICNYIQKHGSNIKVLNIGDTFKCSRVYTLQEWYKPLDNSQLVMICSDDLMCDCYIDNADCVIHYDIPIDKGTFSIRFSVLQDSNTTLIKKDRSAYIFLSNNSKDLLELPKVVDIIKMFGNGEVESILMEQVKIINKSLENEKKNHNFCIEIQQFGYCPKFTICQNRHILFKEFDQPVDNIPKSGLAIVKILNVYDASHMSAKLLKINHTNNLNDEHWLNVEDHSNTIHEKLDLFYSKSKFRIIPQNFNLTDFVAVQLEMNMINLKNGTQFFRAIIIDMAVGNNARNSEVRVKLIDLGFEYFVSKWRVFILPDMFKNIPTTTVDIILACVKPVDLDKKWCSQANICVRNQLLINDSFIVKVKIALGTTIWIKKLYKKKEYDFEVILPDILFNNGYADLNTEHLDKLTELSISAGISMPLTLKHNVKENHELSIEEFMALYKLPKPQWAHLDKNSTIVVTVDYIVSPSIIFVQNYIYYDRYNDLLEKIDCYIKEKKVDRLKHIVKGAFCLAKYRNTDKYYRVQIYEILEKGVVEVLSVDTGEFYNIQINFLLTIHPNLIIQLPFQAIECSLSGIKDIFPSGDELDELINYIFELTKNPLHAKVVDTILSAKYTGGNHYKLILYSEEMFINLDFETKFGQYCDSDQMSNLRYLIDNEHYLNDVNYNIKEQYVFDQSLFDDDEMNPDELISKNCLLEDFGRCVLEQMSKEYLIIPTPNIEDTEKENSVIITEEITSPIPENKCTNETIEVIDSAVFNECSQKTSVLKNNKIKLNKNLKNLCLACNTNTQSIVPICIWHQNKDYIFIQLNILEMDDFRIDCTMEGITFCAQFKDESYTFCAVFFGSIFDHNVTHKTSFEGFHIKAEKVYKTECKWPRLFKCSLLHQYVKYNPDHIEIKDLSLLIKELNLLKMQGLGKPLNPVDSDFSDSDSDSEMSCNMLFDDSLC